MKDIAVVMITADRSPRPNYLQQTVDNLNRGGLNDSNNRVVGFTIFTVPGGTSNAAAALREGAAKGTYWVLFLEDDIDVCDDFFNSVGAWLDANERDDRRVYSFAVLHGAMQAQAKGEAWDYPISVFCTGCAFALRREDAADLADWLIAHPTFTGPDGGVNPHAYDLEMRAWAKDRWPEIDFFSASNPSFVQHVGDESFVTPGRPPLHVPSWPGRVWKYGDAVPIVVTSGIGKKRVLWCGDAVVSSGFSRVTHQVLDHLKDWERAVLGVNYLGDPHPYEYPIFPCMNGMSGQGGQGDPFGLWRLKDLATTFQPDIIVLLTDPWNVPRYMRALKGIAIPVVGYLAVDGMNCRGDGLNALAHSIFWTHFGEEQARIGGYTGSASVVPLGVDLNTYFPIDKSEARRKIATPEQYHDWFVVGRVDRNQPRKRLDLMVEYFAEWVKSYDVQNALLHCYIAPTGDVGWDLEQLTQYYFGDEPRLILSEPPLGHGHSEKVLQHVYSSFDVMLHTAQGEGWHLPTLEGMACGTPSIVEAWAALAEWPGDAALKIRCPTTAATPNSINAIGGIMDREDAVLALQKCYEDREFLSGFAQRGLLLAAQPQFRWAHIAQEIDDILTRVIAGAPQRVEVVEQSEVLV